VSYLTDQELAGAVIHAIARDGRVNMSDIVHVSAENGVVLLTGTVWSAAQKQAAEEVVRRVHGVAGVQNDLTVAVEGEISDAELRDQVLATLARHPDLVRRVGCSVDDGIVTLVGHIRDAEQEREAIRIAGAVRGVEQVVSALEIAEIVPDVTVPPIDDATLVGKVADALDRAGVEIQDRFIQVDQGVVTLSGKVSSAQTRRRAEDVVASVDGVRALHNHLVLRLSEESSDPDEVLAARVVHALARDGRVSPSQLRIVATGGVVSVTGQVDSVEDQNAVAEVIRAVPGVRRVEARVSLMGRSSARSGDKGVRGRHRPYRG
jgi:osmotically-inducible protein OsmY